MYIDPRFRDGWDPKWDIQPHPSRQDWYYVTLVADLDPGFVLVHEPELKRVQSDAEHFLELKMRGVLAFKEFFTTFPWMCSRTWPSRFVFWLAIFCCVAMTTLILIAFLNVLELFVLFFTFVTSPWVQTQAFFALLRDHWRGIVRKFVSFFRLWGEYALDVFLKRWFVMSLGITCWVLLYLKGYSWISSVISYFVTIYPVWAHHLDQDEWDDTPLPGPWDSLIPIYHLDSEEASTFIDPLRFSDAPEMTVSDE